ncbi:MAG TPA: DinB family protein [Thermoanaerobaculia bacterium]
MNRDALIAALEKQERDSVAYWDAFDVDAFFANIGESWSPSDTVRHLIKSVRPVGKALTIPKILLWAKFGTSRRPAESYDALVTRYRGLLADGGKAGAFAPSSREEADRNAWRASIMREFATVNRDLRAAIAKWSDAKLDRYQLPHPLLGKLSVREMLYFTLYHLRHHIEVVERNRRELTGTATASAPPAG